MSLVEQAIETRVSLRGAFLRLWVLGLAGAAAIAAEPLPANLMNGARFSELAMRAIGFLNTALVLAALIALGAYASCKVGLYSVLAPRIPARAVREKRAFHWVQAALLAGAAIALAQGLFDLWFWRAVPEGHVVLLRQAEQMASAASLSSVLLRALNDELMLRWGLMSGLLWALALLFRQPEGKRPRAALAWAAIIGVSVLSSAGLWPSLAHVMASDPAGVLLVRGAIGSALAGIVYGWLYWKHGLEAAILAHAAAQSALLVFAGASLV